MNENIADLPWAELFKKDWTLFLDRDGVINVKLKGDYVKSWKEFIFLPDVLEALSVLKDHFKYIIILTNQQGIGKHLMTEDDLHSVHKIMLEEIKEAGGKIDAIYFCPSLAAANDPKRKPGIGMALDAKKDFPDIDFTNSVMVGDSESDMMMADKLHMTKVFIGNINDLNKNYIHNTVVFNSLYEFAEKMKTMR